MPVIESQQKILQKFADPIIKKLLNKVIKGLQNLKITLSGIENGNTWDDICIQVQTQYSFFWSQYEDAMEGFISLELASLPFHEKMAIWFQTESGQKMIGDEIYNLEEKLGIEDLEEPGYFEPEVLSFLFSKLEGEAGEWSNQRIRDYVG